MVRTWDKPVVVLTSKFSASASEILAGALQDYGRGVIVGDTTTHGKGTVQTLMDLSEVFYRARGVPNQYGALKITRSQFYRPNGDSTQKRGVLSDLVIPSVSDKMPVGESDLEFPVEFDRISAADYQPYGWVTSEIKPVASGSFCEASQVVRQVLQASSSHRRVRSPEESENCVSQ